MSWAMGPFFGLAHGGSSFWSGLANLIFPL